MHSIIRFLILILSLSTVGCAFKSVQRSKDISYMQANSAMNLPEKQLNIFAPKKAEKLPVLIFIHGGSWNSGRKEIYNFMGNRLARRGVVTVIIDYPLAPEYQLPEMEKATLLSVKWVQENIANYGGDPAEIYISGHSAGGHLAALSVVKDDSWKEIGVDNPLKGAILNDPAGLDWYWFLTERKEKYDAEDNYDAFTDSPVVWKEFSPIYFLDGKEIPMLLMEGEKTYPGIRLTVDRFRKEAEANNTDLTYSFYKKKKHIPMITQFFWTWSKGYKDVLGFIEKR
ncbi:alpha/beta hydrolase [Algoriphagus litoralis]|uniref:alpha/beta hydrolase n=1 Tax=Algoriphagus litoralis TaxID=2202829 RepID=UPI000DB9C727|nr:alpha/beta hydrolase [Algoriphagus litoralis]